MCKCISQPFTRHFWAKSGDLLVVRYKSNTPCVMSWGWYANERLTFEECYDPWTFKQLIMNKNCLKIQKWQTGSVNFRRTDNIIMINSKRKKHKQWSTKNLTNIHGWTHGHWKCKQFGRSTSDRWKVTFSNPHLSIISCFTFARFCHKCVLVMNIAEILPTCRWTVINQSY